nr:hypothetical protein B0A51_01666 [Rachicladosporium sp. CCFEE 5018]
MPLSDITNAQQPPAARYKRFSSIGTNSSPGGQDENADPSPRATPARLRGFLNQTKASSAKTATPPAQRTPAQLHSGRNTPLSQRHNESLRTRPGALTQLPTPVSKWNGGQSSVRSAPRSTPLSNSKSSPLLAKTNEASHNASPQSPSMPLLSRRKVTANKPLPARPIARLVHDPSPSKASRTLIDAHDKPLRLSVAGSVQEWPALTPSPNAPHHRFDDRCSSLVTFVSASEAVIDTEYGNGLTDSPFPPRKSSMGKCTSNTAPLQSNKADAPALSSNIAAKSPSETVSKSTKDARRATSRPHSPSPASFSRPRPASISYPRASGSPSVESSPAPAPCPNTASHIPLSAHKKATLVDIKGRRSSAIPTPLKSERGLSFGGRRIESPDPLKILDHGIKRRQLRRANTNETSSTVSTVPTKVLNSDATPPLGHSIPGSLESATGSSTEDEEEVTTPSDTSLHFVKHGYKPKHLSKVAGSHYAGATLKVYDEAEVILGKPPPSNSPFTGPLQTIPSEAMLPVMHEHDSSQTGNCQPKVVIKPTEFPAFAQRLSSLQDQHVAANRRTYGSNTIDDTTKTGLVTLLREANHEDALISQCGSQGLDKKTKQDITRTLSLLEGKCGPPTTEIDPEQLFSMFGRLRSGFEKAPKSAAFVEDATLAERFLARRDSSPHQVQVPDEVAAEDLQQQIDRFDRVSHPSMSKTLTSKWSESTSSAKGPPPDIDHSMISDIDTSATTWDGFAAAPHPLDVQGTSSGSNGSIGFPSLSKVHQILGPDERSIQSQQASVRRTSSPVLGSRLPGSVRNAREMARNAADGVGRATASRKKKSDKTPATSAPLQEESAELPRGRLTFAHKTASTTSVNGLPKTPRSRSKSRFMLDKLNGLFHKREHTISEIPPPLPTMHKHSATPQSTKNVKISANGSPVLRTTRTPPLTKMPTFSPPVDASHPALSSSAASVARTMTPADDNMDQEGRNSLHALSAKLVGRAQKEGDMSKKERLLNFAKVLNDSLISAREAQISAETAQTAARSAQLSYEMTMKSVAMLQRLASSMNRT